MLTRVHHVGLVVRRLEDGLAFWQDALGLEMSKQATVADQGVKAALLPIGRSEIELLEPINPQGGVAKFLEKRGEGLHHVCFETPDVAGELERARAEGFPLIDETPRAGLAGEICFLHPKGTRGVLVEFATPPPGEAHHATAGRGALAGLALAEVTARSKDTAGAATLFVQKLGLVSAGADAVTVGGVRLRFLADDAGGESLAGLVLEVADPVAARSALDGYGPTAEPDGFHLDPRRCRGVPLRVRRAS
jgi:methylmalonyl-CoA/ethylmalonyl-CoA epimerase